jgi:hypothetical protein
LPESIQSHSFLYAVYIWISYKRTPTFSFTTWRKRPTELKHVKTADSMCRLSICTGTERANYVNLRLGFKP